MELQQPQVNIAQEQNDRFSKKLQETIYSEPISHLWIVSAWKVLQNNSLLSLGVSAKDYEALLKALRERSLNMMQFAVLSNVLEASTPKQLGLSDCDEYLDAMQEVSRLSIRWNEESQKIKDDVKKEIEMLLAAATPAEERLGMKVVRAEA